MTTNRVPNRLIHEKSPYLLQHAHNPVDWHPWGEEAFEKAKRENKPVFISIGYSTCHWCHVMERESFEDSEVAELLNKHFISIKVDREERPDVDSIYMTVCQVMTGHGGWPLNVFVTPDQVPFYVGTYFPKHSRQGIPGMLDVISQLAEIYEKEPGKVAGTGRRILAAIQPRVSEGMQDAFSEELIKVCYERLNKTFDELYGGFGEAPKFPTPHTLMFLLRYHHWTGDERALFMAEKTLKGLADGGIYDHIGFGFARYSTDEEYLVPHFEKMLYDNAMLAITYIEAFQVTGYTSYRQKTEEIFTYVFRDMLHPDGAFYSAEDADSEGVEGKFYVWSPDEVKEVLGKEDGELFCDVYDITEEGNFEGKNIPNLIDQSLEDFTGEQDMDTLVNKLESSRQKLFEHREKRIHPHKDDKILTSWNALMIAALAKASRVFDNPSFAEAGRKALSFIEDQLTVDGRLMVRFRDGDVKQRAFIDEYAYLLWAYIEMYEATLDLSFILKAKRTAENMISLFWDQDAGGFYFYGKDQENLLVRPKEAYDGALPSGNSVAALQLIRLSRLTGETGYEEKADQLMGAFAEQVQTYPPGHTYMLMASMTTKMKMKEAVVLTDGPSLFLEKIRKDFHPEWTYLAAKEAEDLEEASPFAAEYRKMDGSTYYICENFVCHTPITDTEEALTYLTDDDGNRGV